MKALGMKDAYRLYKKELPKTVGRNTFMKLVSGFNEFVMNKVIQGEHVFLPEKTGSLYVMGSPVEPRVEDGEIKGLAINWQATKEARAKDPNAKYIYYFNESTGGIRYRIKWSKKKMFIRNRDFYRFFLTRGNKKAISNFIRSGNSYVVEEYHKNKTR